MATALQALEDLLKFVLQLLVPLLRHGFFDSGYLEKSRVNSHPKSLT
jgi:hypothetical protein